MTRVLNEARARLGHRFGIAERSTTRGHPEPTCGQTGRAAGGQASWWRMTLDDEVEELLGEVRVESGGVRERAQLRDLASSRAGPPAAYRCGP